MTLTSKTSKPDDYSWLWNIRKFHYKRVIVRFKNGEELRGRLIESSVCNITVKQGMLWWRKKIIIPYGDIADLKRASVFT